MANPNGTGKPGSDEWQKQLNDDIDQHDQEARGTSEGQDFEIGGGR